MIVVDEVLISDDVVEKEFSCNLDACKGACCVEGDAGAPLEEGEADIIRANIEFIKEEMDEKGLSTLEHLGVSELDPFGESVTTCKANKECVFAVWDIHVLSCAIEKANRKHQFGFPKPISCHLYPIRAKEYKDFHALNYDKWDICSPACDKGQKEGIRVFEFAKVALLRKFGEPWYNKLEKLAEEHLDS